MISHRRWLLVALAAIAGAVLAAQPWTAFESKSPAADTSAAHQFTADDTRIADCAAGDFGCLRQAYGNLAAHEGPKVALSTFDAQMQRSSEFRNNCHPISHSLGAGALRYFDNDAAKAMGSGTGSCASGYYHGLLTEALLRDGSSDVAAAAQRICTGPSASESRFVASQCGHGLGHGVFVYKGFDLSKALTMCEQIKLQDDSSCASGVFMENFSSSYGVESTWLRKDDPIYPCNMVAEHHRYACYEMVGNRIGDRVFGAWKTAQPICERAGRSWASTCFRSLGAYVSEAEGRMNPAINRACQQMGAANAPDCIWGAAMSLMNRSGKLADAPPLCRVSAGRSRQLCAMAVGQMAAVIHGSTAPRQAACSALPEREMQRQCRLGAGLQPPAA